MQSTKSASMRALGGAAFVSALGVGREVGFGDLFAGGRADEDNGADEVDQFAEAVFVEAGPGVFLGQDALEPGIIALDGDHSVVHHGADGGLLGAVLQGAPARGGRHPEDVLSALY